MNSIGVQTHLNIKCMEVGSQGLIQKDFGRGTN